MTLRLCTFRWFGMLFAASFVLAISPGTLRAQRRGRVNVHVVDVAGGLAYLDAGTSQGLRKGVRVQFGRQRVRVQSATSKFATVSLKSVQLRRGQRGFARVSVNRGRKPVHGIPEVASSESFRGKWKKPVLPATQEKPERYVPLGEQIATRDERSYLVARAWFSPRMAFRDPSKGSYVGGVDLRTRIDPFESHRLRFEADLSARLYSDSRFSNADNPNSRPAIFVRQLQLSYLGDDVSGAFGRLRYASAMVGMLDGARVELQAAEGLRLAAFGGVVPRPDDAMPSFDARRFGVEFSYQDVESPTRPSLTVTTYGSHFAGALDERRIAARGRLTGSDWGAGAYAEVSFFDRDNPWGASPSELSAGGADGQLRFGDLELRGRVDVRRPERSQWLASQLPLSFFCDDAGQGAAGGCTGVNEPRLLGALSTLYRVPNGSLSLGVSYINTFSSAVHQFRGFATGRYGLVPRTLFVNAGLSASDGSLLARGAGSVGMSYLARDIELGLDYRPRITFYNSDIESSFDQRFDMRARWNASSTVAVLADAYLFVGRDQRAFLGTISFLWRPTW